MGTIKVNYEQVRSTIEKMTQKLQTDFGQTAVTNYNNMISAIQLSKGDAIDRLKEEIEAEQKIVEETETFFRQLLELILSATNAIEEVDKDHEATIASHQ